MLKQRILSTIKFFDLQDFPVTLLELEKYLLDDVNNIKTHINTDWDVINYQRADKSADYKPEIRMDTILKCLETECQNEVENFQGFYYLKGRKAIAEERLQNYFYGIKREKLIRRYVRVLRHLPFVRGLALAGSQALGQEKSNSDIDLFIVVESNFLWLSRTLVTAYFQIIGRRRHGKYVTNRFCLNHYVAGTKQINEFKNLYTAAEYIKLRPLVYAESIIKFQVNNSPWLNLFFPNFNPPDNLLLEQPSSLQKNLEKMFQNSFGRMLEGLLKKWQMARIRKEQFILVEEDELSFHPNSKQQELLSKFFTEEINYVKVPGFF